VDNRELGCDDRAEIMRKRDRYRQLILSGRITLPVRRAAQLLGPDCAYRLYSVDKKPKKS
jgi:hypothetical protein